MRVIAIANDGACSEGSGEIHRLEMDHYTNMAGMWLVGQDMPRGTNRVTLNGKVKDKWGSPAPNVHFDDHDNDIAMRNHAFAQGEKVCKAAGAIRTYRTPPYPSTHNLGTCRMGKDAKTASATPSARPTTSLTCTSPTAVNSPPAARRIPR